MDSGYDLNDPKHPTYHDRMADWGDELREREKSDQVEPYKAIVIKGFEEDWLCFIEQVGLALVDMSDMPEIKRIPQYVEIPGFAKTYLMDIDALLRTGIIE
jgi:hypothetical protein